MDRDRAALLLVSVLVRASRRGHNVASHVQTGAMTTGLSEGVCRCGTFFALGISALSRGTGEGAITAGSQLEGAVFGDGEGDKHESIEDDNDVSNADAPCTVLVPALALEGSVADDASGMGLHIVDKLPSQPAVCATISSAHVMVSDRELSLGCSFRSLVSKSDDTADGFVRGAVVE